MQLTLPSMLVATAGLASLTSAAPLDIESRAGAPICDAYPWFIVPYKYSSCNSTPATYQPNSGPIAYPPVPTYCAPLSNESPALAFGSVAINRDACPGYTWTINLYADQTCSAPPTVITSDGCVEDIGGYGWMAFDAIPNYGN